MDTNRIRPVGRLRPLPYPGRRAGGPAGVPPPHVLPDGVWEVLDLQYKWEVLVRDRSAMYVPFEDEDTAYRALKSTLRRMLVTALEAKGLLSQ